MIRISLFEAISRFLVIAFSVSLLPTTSGTAISSLIRSTSGSGRTILQSNDSVLVFVGGVQQQANVNYQFTIGASSNQISITPSTSGDANQPILIIHNINSTNVPA